MVCWLSRLEKWSSCIGNWLPAMQMEGPQLLLAFVRGETDLFCIRLTFSICVLLSCICQHKENLHLFLASLHGWINLCFFFFTHFHTHTHTPFSHLEYTAYPLSFWMFSSKSHCLPIQKSQVSRMEYDATGQNSHYCNIRQANGCCLFLSLTKPCQQFFILFFFSQWEMMKKASPPSNTNWLYFSKPFPQPTQTFVGKRRLDRGISMAQRVSLPTLAFVLLY